MDYQRIYTEFEDFIEPLEETAEAEGEVNRLVSKLKDRDPELFFDLDCAIGALARAYEKQGFNGGLTFIKEIALT
ncbi:MAG: hypothetical protein J6Y20_00925 [Lachnospiraceae bacterium]|nr:hypothetical protein [Lachnospiraceae bacterium]